MRARGEEGEEEGRGQGEEEGHMRARGEEGEEERRRAIGGQDSDVSEMPVLYRLRLQTRQT